MMFCALWVCVLLCFFFSSRRRHTRYIGDWSSDVCSSDLEVMLPSQSTAMVVFHHPGGLTARLDRYAWYTWSGPEARSEERRVGKECRSRWSPDRERKKRRKAKYQRM